MFILNGYRTCVNCENMVNILKIKKKNIKRESDF